jgi:hypothetical protein
LRAHQYSRHRLTKASDCAVALGDDDALPGRKPVDAPRRGFWEIVSVDQRGTPTIQAPQGQQQMPGE